MADRAEQADRRADRGQRQEQWHARRQQRAEDDDQDQQGDRQRGELGPGEVFFERFRDRLFAARVADLFHPQGRVFLLHRGDLVERLVDHFVRFDPAPFGDFELDQGGAAVGRDLAVGARVVGPGQIVDEGQLAQSRFDRADGFFDVLAAGGFFAAAGLDQHLLALTVGEGRFQGLTGTGAFADAGLAVGERLRPQRAAERDRGDDEEDPSPDRRLAVAGAPAPRPSRQAQLPSASHPVLRPVWVDLGALFRRLPTLRERRSAANEASRRIPLRLPGVPKVGLTPPRPAPFLLSPSGLQKEGGSVASGPWRGGSSSWGSGTSTRSRGFGRRWSSTIAS